MSETILYTLGQSPVIVILQFGTKFEFEIVYWTDQT